MKQKDNMRQTFIECAVRVVARDGLDKTTTKLIAKEAGLNEAYIYRCFKNKEDLLSEAFYMEDVSFIGHIQNTLERKMFSALEVLLVFHFGKAG